MRQNLIIVDKNNNKHKCDFDILRRVSKTFDNHTQSESWKMFNHQPYSNLDSNDDDDLDSDLDSNSLDKNYYKLEFSKECILFFLESINSFDKIHCIYSVCNDKNSICRYINRDFTKFVEKIFRSKICVEILSLINYMETINKNNIFSQINRNFGKLLCLSSYVTYETHSYKVVPESYNHSKLYNVLEYYNVLGKTHIVNECFQYLYETIINFNKKKNNGRIKTEHKKLNNYPKIVNEYLSFVEKKISLKLSHTLAMSHFIDNVDVLLK